MEAGVEAGVATGAAAWLAQRAASRPEAPWLFHPRGLDWRWISWGEGWRRVEALASDLASHPRLGEAVVGRRVAFPHRTHPAPAADPSRVGNAFSPLTGWWVALAVEAAGGVPVPIPTGDGVPVSAAEALAADGAPGAAALWVAPAAVLEEPDSPRRSGERPEGPATRSPWHDDAQLEVSVWRVERVGGEEARGAESPEGLSPGVALVGDPGFGAADAGAESGGGTEVAVCGPSLTDLGNRLLLAWSLRTGASLVLEANPAAWVATATWARPSLFLGDAAHVERLRWEAEEWARQWSEGWFRRSWRGLLRALGVPPRRRPPFDRLHTVVWADGADEAPFPEAGYWISQGVRTLRLASLVQ